MLRVLPMIRACMSEGLCSFQVVFCVGWDCGLAPTLQLDSPASGVGLQLKYG